MQVFGVSCSSLEAERSGVDGRGGRETPGSWDAACHTSWTAREERLGRERDFSVPSSVSFATRQCWLLAAGLLAEVDGMMSTVRVGRWCVMATPRLLNHGAGDVEPMWMPRRSAKMHCSSDGKARLGLGNAV